MKASFFKRVAAYFIDAMIVSIIASIISMGFSSSEYNKSVEECELLTEKYVAQEITSDEYLEEYGKLIYDMQKSSVVVSIVTISATIAYFIVFQYLNKGQTIGKKLLKLKVKENGNNPSLRAIIIRTVMVNNIFSGTLGIILLYILNKDNYYMGYSLISSIEMLFIFISALFILYRKDKLGLHDIIAKTEVIEEK